MRVEKESLRSLTRLCIDKAKETGEKKISLHSAEIMYAARHIYETEGFKKIKSLMNIMALLTGFIEWTLNNLKCRRSSAIHGDIYPVHIRCCR